jgi:hypothetical protein
VVYISDWPTKVTHSDWATGTKLRLAYFILVLEIFAMLQFLVNNYVQAPSAQILNAVLKDDLVPEVTSSVELARKLNGQIMVLFQSFVSEDGREVDYKKLGGSNEYKEYCVATKGLTLVNLDDMETIDRKVLFLNLYNSLTIHAYLHKGIPKSFLEKLNIIQTYAYQIGSFVFTLDDMEHGILRGNNKPPKGTVKFGKNDPRLKFTIPLDPRIHFALVCGSKGCPPIKIYSEKNLERGLDASVKFFLSDPNNFKIDNNTLWLSQIFEWYAGDFESGPVKWLAKYVEEDLSKLHVRYIKYDWGLNGTH